MHKRAAILLVLSLIALATILVPSARAAEPEGYRYLYEEIGAGREFQAKFMSRHYDAPPNSATEVGRAVFARLTQTSGITIGPPFPYQLTIYESGEINAFSYLGGQVFVPSAMANMLGTTEGLWAAVLSHEIGHCYCRHALKSLLQAERKEAAQANLRRQAAAGNSSAQIALAVGNLVGTVIERKIDRNEEHEADRTGIELMVQAGYHPNWAVSLYRKLKARFGDDSKFAAFFATHPRWETREERAFKMFDDALAEFDSRWPDVQRSPGGVPPPVAFIKSVRASNDKTAKIMSLTIEYAVSDPRRAEVGAIAFFFDNKKFVQGVLEDYRDREGHLAAIKDVERHGNFERGAVTLTVPAAALAAKDRKVEAIVELITAEDVLDVSDPAKVEFPKP